MIDFKAAIFDLDGTLIDSLGVWDKIDVDFLAKRNLKVPKGYGNEISSKSFTKAAEYTITRFDLKESVEDLISEWNTMALYEYSHNIFLKSYAREYLQLLKNDNIQLGVATSLSKVLYEPVLKNNGIYEIFSAISSTDEVSHGKEFPDLFLLEAEKLKVSPKDCVVFDDIYAGICGSKKAGMKAIGVYDQYSECDKLKILQISDGYIYNFSEMF